MVWLCLLKTFTTQGNPTLPKAEWRTCRQVDINVLDCRHGIHMRWWFMIALQSKQGKANPPSSMFHAPPPPTCLHHLLLSWTITKNLTDNCNRPFTIIFTRWAKGNQKPEYVSRKKYKPEEQNVSQARGNRWLQQQASHYASPRFVHAHQVKTQN